MAYTYRYGDTNPVKVLVDSANVIEKGDMCTLETDDVRAAASEAWDTNLATTQENFHDGFLGVAAQRSRNGDTDAIRINTSGVYEFDTASATYEVGDLVGPAKQTGNALESQKVASVAGHNLAVGRVAKQYAAATTKVYVEILSVIMRGGSLAAA